MFLLSGRHAQHTKELEAQVMIVMTGGDRGKQQLRAFLATTINHT